MALLGMKSYETTVQSPYQREAWSHIRALLPPDPELERLAREKGALSRRRGVKAAAALLRLLLSYACSTLSFRGVCSWALDSDWAQMSKTAVRRRLHNAVPWLEHLAELVLDQRKPTSLVAGLNVLLLDGTRITPPGIKGSGWCCHTVLDPWTAQTVQFELTDRKGAEHLGRFRLRKDDFVVADRGFAHRRGLATVVEQQAFFLVRTNWRLLPLETRHGRPFDLFESLADLPEEGVADLDVRIKADKEHAIPALDCRLVVYRKTEKAAEEARKKARTEARKRHCQVDDRTLLGCQYVLLVTNVDRGRITDSRILELYRLRWQIELGFKRWKSLLDVGSIQVKHADSIRATLTAKLLGAILVEQIVAPNADRMGLWEQTKRVGIAFRQALLGEQAVAAVLAIPASATPPRPNRKALLQCERTRQSLQRTPDPQLLSHLAT